MKNPGVPITAIYPIMKSIVHKGFDIEEYFSYSSFDCSLLEDTEARITEEELERLMIAAANYTQDNHFGLHQGQIIELADMGILGYVILHSKTVVDALLAYQRYNVILCSVFNLEWQVEGDDVLIFFSLQLPDHISRHVVEEMASSLYHLINKLSNQHILLHEIRFVHEASADLQPYTVVFGKVPCFGGKDNVLRMSKDVLNYPILYSDAKLLGVFEKMARETKDELTQSSLFSDQVVQWMKKNVPSFFPTLQQAADYFKISIRTLQNKLKAEQTSYNELSVQVRKELAISYLQKREYSIGDIAYLLHFSEPSAFQSAFKKWTGLTPGQYRTQMRVFDKKGLT
ncbi:AraC family transcriptional regulator [Paenibacillus taiwanensis]|uniref:AraC family transcriptional regulator n=1 Tax=Paenibacillus taiwanensis TaxID=401638 RepID=UPI0003FA8624|nr:AraC family transcriptional regulator [Paenibacillus taiwanensis]